LNTNTFTGPIPQEWQDLTSLYILDIQANYVLGTVEPWVLGLANLSQLFISYNQLQGPLPSIINNTNTRATGIWINCNYFTGEVPVFGPTIVDYLDSANCFDTTNENILSDTYCARRLNCQGFQQDVTQNGELIKLRLSHMSFIFLTFVSVCFDFPLFNVSFELGLIVVALSSSKVPFFGGVVLQAAHHVLMGNILPTPLSAFAMKVFTPTQL
jgi:hypothetical protein